MLSIPLAAFLAGLIGTAATHLFLFLLALGNLVETRLPAKLGAILFRKASGVGHIGVLLHYVFGILFGLIYANLLMLAEPTTPSRVFAWAELIGGVHGLLAALALLVFAELHPVAEFRRVSVSTAVAYAAAHLIYAFGVAAVLLALGVAP